MEIKGKISMNDYQTDEVFISTGFIKLDSFLKFSGMTETGGIAKEIISQGKVKVNGETCTARGKKLYPGDMVTIDEAEINILVRAENE